MEKNHDQKSYERCVKERRLESSGISPQVLDVSFKDFFELSKFANRSAGCDRSKSSLDAII